MSRRIVSWGLLVTLFAMNVTPRAAFAAGPVSPGGAAPKPSVSTRVETSAATSGAGAKLRVRVHATAADGEWYVQLNNSAGTRSCQVSAGSECSIDFAGLINLPSEIVVARSLNPLNQSPDETARVQLPSTSKDVALVIYKKPGELNASRYGWGIALVVLGVINLGLAGFQFGTLPSSSSPALNGVLGGLNLAVAGLGIGFGSWMIATAKRSQPLVVPEGAVNTSLRFGDDAEFVQLPHAPAFELRVNANPSALLSATF